MMIYLSVMDYDCKWIVFFLTQNFLYPYFYLRPQVITAQQCETIVW